ncbi:nucleotidyltransferase domain-containing protein [Thermus sp.]|uniref:nucleotidyltransferase domain-containing protein n=1 Tax=Thermus sp. TaxID=275 RepID=UPI00307F866F
MYFGSYARGKAGVGSDRNLVLLAKESALPLWQRPAQLPLEELPAPAEALVYTLEEWQALPQKSPRFAKTLCRETRWVFGTDPSHP